MKENNNLTEAELEMIAGGSGKDSKICYRCTKCGYERIFDNFEEYLPFGIAHGIHQCFECGELGYIKVYPLTD
ncbi:MAG: hypothetical protein LBL98_02075 [Ruminococcus sp.]|jgi:hypothetical protein|nr:hypothetical protein [Ruminococcus sp.]